MNSLTYNSTAFSSYNCYIDGSLSFGSPEKDYEMVSVLGRDGDLAIYNDRFMNIDIEIPCYIPNNFITNYRSLLAYLHSLDGYQRLEISTEPNHFRMALFKAITEPTVSQFDRSGTFSIVFTCMPQRWLKSGETPVESESQSHTYTGNPVTIQNPSSLSALSSLQVALNPIQTGTGDPSPSNIRPIYPANGKNLLELTDGTYTIGGIPVVISNGKLTINGTTTASGGRTVRLSPYFVLKAGTYILSPAPGSPYIRGYLNKKADDSVVGSYSGTAFTTTEDVEVYYGINVENNKAYNITIAPQLEKGSTITSWSPYQGISGLLTGKNLLNVTATQKTSLGITFENNNGIVTANGTATGLANISLCGSNGVKLKANTTYILSGCPSGGGDYTYQVDLRVANSITTHYKNVVDKGNGFTFTTDNAVTVYPMALVRSGYSANNLTFKPMIRYASETDDTFEPYTGTPITISMGQDVYGGSVDLVSGVLTVDRASITYDGSSDESWIKGSTAAAYENDWTRFVIVVSDAKVSAQPITNWLRGKSDDTGTTYTPTQAHIDPSTASYAIDLVVPKSFATNASEWKTYLASNPLQVVYELATPTTAQLTPQQISLLTGTNIITFDDQITAVVTEPSLLVNPTLFESKPLIRVYGAGTVTINNQYITISAHSFPYIDIDCDMMDAYYQSSNANQYVSFSTTDYVTLKSGNNYVAYTGGTLEITPRWYEV